jgi:hypothetical protein
MGQLLWGYRALKNFLILALSIGLFLAAVPAYAFDLGLDFDGNLSVGLGGGFGDNDVGPGVLSGKYSADWLEVGAELFYDGDKEDEIDQLGLVWLIYRHDLHVEENNTPWLGVGFGETFDANSYEDSFGFVSAMGWQGRGWGMELKYGYFDPSLYSFVVYYDF